MIKLDGAKKRRSLGGACSSKFNFFRCLGNILQLFRPMNIRVALTMVEIWHQRDLIEVVEDSDACLDNFMVYRNGDLWKKRKHDNAMLLT